MPRLRHSLIALTLPMLLAGLIHWQHWDDQARLWWQQRDQPQSVRQASVWLPDYRVSIDGKPLIGLDDDETSDLAYSPSSGTLFTVTGRNPTLVELSRRGEVLRRIALHGFSNPEGVAILENGQVAIIDERRRNLSLFNLTPQTRELNLDDGSPLDLGFADAGNKGFEGIAWDPAQQRVLLGLERSPALFSLGSDGQHLLDHPLQALANEHLDMRNLSALSVDPRTGHLLVLSAQSRLLLELDEHGEPVSFLTLRDGDNGLNQGIPRAEGVAMDDQGTLYMVSEPNLFYVYQRQSPGPLLDASAKDLLESITPAQSKGAG